MALRHQGKEQKKETGINRFFEIHKPVFWPAVILIVSMIVTTLVLGEQAETMFSTVQTVMSDAGGWFFILAVNVFLIFSLFVAFSKVGSIRIGGDDARPEFSNLAWFAMLFSAGMGIGIMFWSVAEPIYHFTDPPMAGSESIPAARQAMGLTFLHWGFHAWGIYAVVALSLAFFAFNRGLPLSPACCPLIVRSSRCVRDRGRCLSRDPGVQTCRVRTPAPHEESASSRVARVAGRSCPARSCNRLSCAYASRVFRIPRPGGTALCSGAMDADHE